MARPIDEPVDHEDHWHQLVHDEIHPRDRRLQLLLQAGEKEREHDAGDRHVQDGGGAGAVEERRACGTSTSAKSAATARMFDWIVKKLKKFAVWKSSVAVAANW